MSAGNADLLDRKDAGTLAVVTSPSSLTSKRSFELFADELFQEQFAIPTQDAADWEFFVIGSDAYLAVANTKDDSWNFEVPSKIYRWNGASFVEFQSIIGYAASDWEFFTIGSDAYLALANSRGANSTIYHWNGTIFVEIQSIPSTCANDWEFFTIGSDAYLAVANMWGTESTIYRWNGTGFVEVQSIIGYQANDWEFFTIGSDAYLALANTYDGTSSNIDSKIYRWNGAAGTGRALSNSKPFPPTMLRTGSSLALAATPTWPWRIPRTTPP